MTWQERSKELTGTKDFIYQLLRNEGYDMTREEVRNFVDGEESLKIDLSKQPTKEISINKDGTQTSEKWVEVYNAEQLKDNEFLLRLHGYDPAEWIIEWAKSTIWQNYSNKNGLTDLYANKITVRRRKLDDGVRKEDLIELLDSLVGGYDIPVNQKHEEKGMYLLEPNIFDLHFAKLAWAGETGENYDYKIASDRFEHVIDDIIAKTRGCDINRIVFPFGNDYFNFNNATGTTEAGTLQNNDLRWQKSFVKGSDLVKRGICRLAEVANVDFLYIPGNHSCLLEFCASYAMACYFSKDERVNVDFGATARKYYEYGQALIGYTHGDKEKKRLDKIMQAEMPEAWGRTKFHEWHTGHLHSEHVKTDIGLKQRTIPSVSGIDAWHYESGYVGVLAQAQTFIWEKEKGLEQIIYSTVQR